MTPVEIEQRRSAFEAAFNISTLKHRMIDGRAIKMIDGFPVLESAHVVPDGVTVGVLADIFDGPGLIVESLENFMVRWSNHPATRHTWPFLLVDFDEYRGQSIEGLTVDPPMFRREVPAQPWMPAPLPLPPLTSVQATLAR